MSVPQETDVGASAGFSKLVQLTRVATHWTARTDVTEPGTLAQDTQYTCRGGVQGVCAWGEGAGLPGG